MIQEYVDLENTYPSFNDVQSSNLYSHSELVRGT